MTLNELKTKYICVAEQNSSRVFIYDKEKKIGYVKADELWMANLGQNVPIDLFIEWYE